MRAAEKMPAFLAAVFVCLLLSSFSRADGARVVVSGHIARYGNEPFTYCALKADDDEVYRIRADAEIDRKLRALCGVRVELSGTVCAEEDGGFKCIECSSFRQLGSGRMRHDEQ